MLQYVMTNFNFMIIYSFDPQTSVFLSLTIKGISTVMLVTYLHLIHILSSFA